MSANLDHLAKQATIGLEHIQLKFARSAEAGAAIAGLEAIRALQTRVTELEADTSAMAYTESLDAAPSVKPGISPRAWIVYAPSGNVRLWSKECEAARKFATEKDLPLVPLYALEDLTPQMSSKSTEAIEQGAPSKLAQLIANDRYAMTFQNFSQYRKALLVSCEVPKEEQT